MKVLCIGSSVIETTCVIKDVVTEGKNIIIDNKTECSGGHAGNIAYLLGKWGVECYIASMLGADDAAAKIKKDFEMIGVKTDYIETSYDKKTGQTIVLVNEVNKNKTVLDLVSNSFLKKYSFGIEPDIIVSDGNDFNATISACDKYPKVPFYLVVSKYDNQILELCKYEGTIIINRSTAELMTNSKIDYNNSNTLVNLYNKLKQKFSKSEIVVTLGERGVLYAFNDQVKIMPPVRVGIVDTNGAGDTFAGAFIYGMGRNFGLEKSLAYASIAGSMSTTKLTSRNSIPSLTEVSSYYDQKFGAQNNPNNQAQPQTTNTNAVQQQAPETKPNEEVAPQVTPTTPQNNGGEENANK